MADEDLFLSKMRALGVRPLAEERQRKAPERPPVQPLFEPEVEASESDLFLQAMGELGLGMEDRTGKKTQDSEPEELRSTGHAATRQDSGSQPQDLGQEADLELFLSALDALDQPPSKETPKPIEQSQTVRKLKPPRSVRTEPDEVLDLHRLRVREALTHLKSFVRQAVENRSKLALVITGKGHHSKNGVSVLKQAVEEWLRRDGKGFIHAFSDAAPSQGGRGAFLLHLRQPTKP